MDALLWAQPGKNGILVEHVAAFHFGILGIATTARCKEICLCSSEFIMKEFMAHDMIDLRMMISMTMWCSVFSSLCRLQRACSLWCSKELSLLIAFTGSLRERERWTLDFRILKCKHELKFSTPGDVTPFIIYSVSFSCSLRNLESLTCVFRRTNKQVSDSIDSGEQ
jgi:hypothetical protein